MKATAIEKIKTIIDINDEDLLTLIEQRQEWKALLEEGEQIIKAIEARIRTAVEESGASALVVGEHKVSLTKYTRETVSKDAVKKAVSPEVYESLVTRTTATRLTIK